MNRTRESTPRIMCIDVESNGLHGVGFAVAAVVLDVKGRVANDFRGRCPIVGPIDPWVQTNVLPAIASMPVDHEDVRSLRAGFWNWYCRNKSGALVFADIGWPVEARFFIACVDDDREGRERDAPFPLLEVATLLLAMGEDPKTDRQRFASDLLGTAAGCRHDPYWDALVSACAAHLAIRALATRRT